MVVGTRDEARETFLRVWDKVQRHAPLQPLEALIAEVIDAHPEYHAVLADPRTALETEFGNGSAEGNPFMHMGLHIALREQLQADHPRGIRKAFKRLLGRVDQDRHQVEHRVMDCLAASLWHARQVNALPDSDAYLASVRRLRK